MTKTERSSSQEGAKQKVGERGVKIRGKSGTEHDWKKMNIVTIKNGFEGALDRTVALPLNCTCYNYAAIPDITF